MCRVSPEIADPDLLVWLEPITPLKAGGRRRTIARIGAPTRPAAWRGRVLREALEAGRSVPAAERVQLRPLGSPERDRCAVGTVLIPDNERPSAWREGEDQHPARGRRRASADIG